MTYKPEKMIPMFSNDLGSKEALAIHRVFMSRWLGPGEQVKHFEQAWKDKTGAKYALAVNSCTSALFMAVRALGIDEGAYDIGEEVIMPSIGFIGMANAVISAGGQPVFADVELQTLNLNPAEIERLRTQNTKAIMLLHYGGHPSSMYRILNLAGDIPIIEDSACSPDSYYDGKHCGTIGKIGCFSFDSMKIMSSGDGGIITTDDEDIYNYLKSIRDLGLKQKSGLSNLSDKSNRWWEYDITEPSGYYGMNDILAAMLNIQIKKLNEFVMRRFDIWSTYQASFCQLDWMDTPALTLRGCSSSYYLYCLQIPKHRNRFARYLIDHNIYCTFRYYPLHLVPAFSAYRTHLPISEYLAETAINIPLHQNLTDDDVNYIIETVKSFKP